MSSNSHSIGEQIRSGLKGIHGAGEAIRGTAMEEVDKALDPKSSSKVGPSENKAIADKGLADMKAADDNLGHNHGVQASKGTTSITPTGTTTDDSLSSTNRGAHSVAPGNVGIAGSASGAGTTQVQEEPGINQRF